MNFYSRSVRLMLQFSIFSIWMRSVYPSDWITLFWGMRISSNFPLHGRIATNCKGIFNVATNCHVIVNVATNCHVIVNIAQLNAREEITLLNILKMWIEPICELSHFLTIIIDITVFLHNIGNILVFNYVMANT